MDYTKRFSTFFISFFCFLLLSQASNTNYLRPNIVFILVDDLGWRDLGCYGSEFYETPRIDKLANEGVRFTNAYSACHVCSPTRASILSGQYPARTRLSDWLPGRKEFPFQKFKNAEPAQHLPYEDNSTFAKTLRANGYITAVIGKWHLGEDSASCERQGFDLHIPSEYLKGWPASGYFSPYQMSGLEDGPKGEYLTDRITAEALKFITDNQDNPFFLYLSHYAVHDPIEGRPDLVEKYKLKSEQIDYSKNLPFILEENPDSKKQLTREELNILLNNEDYKGYNIMPDRMVKIKQYQDNNNFAAMVESVDESVGKVLDKLEELDLHNNTLVVFFSDNGGMSAANFGNPRRQITPERLDRNFSTSNLPLRGGKGWLYEGGIRVPLIIKWPQKGKEEKVCNVPVISVDFFPTILEIAGVKLPDKDLDGISITPLLNKNSEYHANLFDRPIFWHFPHYSNHGMQSPGGAVRYGDYKLIHYFENNTMQLFNLADDIGEQKNLIYDKPLKALELRRMLDNWRVEVNAASMKPNPDYDPEIKPENF